MKTIFRIAAAALVFSAGATAHAQNLVVNGGFEQVTATAGGANMPGTDSYHVSNAQGRAYLLPGWTVNSGVANVYGAGLADVTANAPLYTDGTRTNPNTSSLAGPANGSANGMPASSPNGGNFFGEDVVAGTASSSLTQVVNGLVVGQDYTLSFWYAGAQIFGSPASSAKLNWVTILQGTNAQGNNVQDVAAHVYTMNFDGNEKGDFIPWQQAVINFKASLTTETLTFYATASVGPPFSLLDGVSILPGVNALPVPEPSVWVLVVIGLMVLARVMLRRREQSAKASASASA